MLDALKSLFENNVISEEIRSDIEKAWDDKIIENRSIVTQELREEFATRYEHDKAIMVDAIDNLVSEQIKEEMSQFIDDRKQLAEQKAKYAIKMKNDSTLMKEFITRQLASEVKDLHEDHKTIGNKFHKLEEFIVQALAEEIADFYGDQKDVANTKVRLVKEGKEAFAKIKEQFIKRAAKLVESTVETSLKSELTLLKEDIETARRNDFGRKLFEAYASEYQSSYLNENTEVAKLLKVLDKKNQEVMEAKTQVAKALKLIESKDHQVKQLSESKERQEILHELMAPLSTDHKGIMTELLESVQTSKLRTSFDKYLPSVIAGVPATKKQPIMEAKEVTGNKQANTISRQPDANIIDIRRLAGL